MEISVFHQWKAWGGDKPKDGELFVATLGSAPALCIAAHEEHSGYVLVLAHRGAKGDDDKCRLPRTVNFADLDPGSTFLKYSGDKLLVYPVHNSIPQLGPIEHGDLLVDHEADAWLAFDDSPHGALSRRFLQLRTGLCLSRASTKGRATVYRKWAAGRLSEEDQRFIAIFGYDDGLFWKA